jgi:hypothetical protein
MSELWVAPTGVLKEAAPGAGPAEQDAPVVGAHGPNGPLEVQGPGQVEVEADKPTQAKWGAFNRSEGIHAASARLNKSISFNHPRSGFQFGTVRDV